MRWDGVQNEKEIWAPSKLAWMMNGRQGAGVSLPEVCLASAGGRLLAGSHGD